VAPEAKTFAAWTDLRNGPGDADVYFAESGSTFGANILVPNPSTGVQQEPAIGADAYGLPYVVWRHGDNTTGVIRMARAPRCFLLGRKEMSSAGDTLNTGEVRIEWAANAGRPEVTIAVRRIERPQPRPDDCFGHNYDFGPSGLTFDDGEASATFVYGQGACPDYAEYYLYRYDPRTDSWTRMATAPRMAVGDNWEVTFPLDGFSEYAVGGGALPGGGGGGGGGCAITSGPPGEPLAFALPCVILLLWLAAGRRRSVAGAVADRRAKGSGRETN